jgi:hypothetical protein
VTVQVARQAQDGAGAAQTLTQSAPVEQLADVKGKLARAKRHARVRGLGGREHGAIAIPAASAPVEQSWSAPGAGGSAGAASKTGSSKPRDGGIPRDERSPVPHDPTGIGAASGFAPPGGTSFWFFAALLVPFALSVPMGTRGQRSSAIRRLASVVLRPERPG